MPTGRAWPRGLDTAISKIIAIFTPASVKVISTGKIFIGDVFPASTVSMLSEWESTLGLPDPCAGRSPTLEQRRSQVVARLTDSGGSSIAYYSGFALSLGYPIAITEYAPARAGLMRAGEPVRGEAWVYAWTVSAPGYTPVAFRAGQSCAGEPLQTWGNDVLKCEITARAPAHTVVRFGYVAPFLNDSGGDSELMVY
ncbi:YmfQ family protein [Kozakia baliensis]|nr:putative phage tail protein [Kozakia baliensis]